MKRYVKINNNKFIIDLFNEFNLNRFDGTEIFLDEADIPSNIYIKGKCISDEVGVPLFQYIDSKVIENYDNTKLLAYQKQKENKAIIDELNKIDTESVRSLRACIVALLDGKTPDKADSDSIIAKENTAKAERVKIK